MSSKVPKEWIPQQIKAFSLWVSEHLRGKSDVKVQNIITDLSNGVALVELAEILTGKQAPRKWPYRPTKKVEMVENCDLAIDMFKDDDVKFVSISGKDINDGKEVPILGLVWTLILHYSLDKDVGNKETLLEWANNRVSRYQNIHEFTPYGLSMCALLDSYVPDKIKYNTLNPKATKHNSQLAKDVMEELEIPIYIDPEEVDEDQQIDEKVLLTQLTSAKTVLDQLPSQKITDNLTSDRIVERSSSDRIFEGLTSDRIVERSSSDRIFEGLTSDRIVERSSSDRIFEGLTSDRIVERSSTNRIVERSSSEKPVTHEEEEDKNDKPIHQQPPPFVAKEVDGDNIQYADRKFGLIMTMNESDYNEGQKMNEDDDVLLFGEDIDLAVTLEKDGKAFLNPAGAKLNLANPDIEHDVYQQFTFGKGPWNTVIDSFVRKGMVWDVADQYNLNPPAGTPFYLFPFHGRHNQHFVYKDGYIYAKQNGMVVTYIGGDVPFQMMPKNPTHKARQQFKIQLL